MINIALGSLQALAAWFSLVHIRLEYKEREIQTIAWNGLKERDRLRNVEIAKKQKELEERKRLKT